MKTTPTAPRASFFQRYPFLVLQVLLSAVLSVAAVACGSLQSTPSQVGDWGWMLPTEDSFWIHEPGAPFYEAYATTKRLFEETYGEDECPMKRMAFTPHEGPIPIVPEHDFYANGMIGRNTRKAYSIIIRSDLEEAVQERLVIHEMIHACGMRGTVGAGRRHEDPARWLPDPGSIEHRATCALQPDLRMCLQAAEMAQ